MSDLRPTGVPIEIDGVERRFLFTLNVIDEIQEHYEKPLDEIVDMLLDKRYAGECMRYLVTALINDEVERELYKNKQCQLKRVTEQEVGWMLSNDNIQEVTLAVLQAYGVSLPEAEEDDFPNAMSGQLNS